MTVYQLIQNYHAFHGHTFGQWHRMVIGGIIKKQFLKTYPGHMLPIVDSKEPSGTYKVVDYPDNFVQRMVDIIADYAEEIKAQRAQKIIEKPKQATPQFLASSEPEKTPPRKRKRIPIGSQPAYSGNYKRK